MRLKRKCGCVSVVRVIVHISRALDVIIVGQFRLPVSLATTETMEKLIRSAFEIRESNYRINCATTQNYVFDVYRLRSHLTRICFFETMPLTL